MLKNDKGITLVALGITIVVMTIMAAILAYSVSDVGKVGEATNAVQDTYENDKSKAENEIGRVNDEWGNVINKKGIDNETVVKTWLTPEEVSAVNTHTGLQTINYVPDTVDTTVTIPADYNGGVADQNFTQSSLGAQSLSWYVLSADEKGVNLVSSPTSSTVTFCDAGGYDNCLYYLNELSTKLFTKESLGVTADRVHALRLTDIKYAAEQMNGSGYNWDATFVEGSTKNSTFRSTLAVGTSSGNRKYPQIYGTNTGTVNTNNQLYDEYSKKNEKPIEGDYIGSTSKMANVLNVKDTFFYTANNSTCKSALGNFGNSGVAVTLIDSNISSWIATRFITFASEQCDYGLRFLSYTGNGLRMNTLCVSNGTIYQPSNAFRVVAQIPASMVNVSSNGTVTLK